MRMKVRGGGGGSLRGRTDTSLDDVETDIEQDVMALEKKLKLVQEGNERLLSEMLNENISLERSIKTVNTEKERRNLLITLHSVMKSVRVARSRLRSVQVRNHGEQTVATDTSTKRKLALQRAIYTIKQRIEDVRRCVLTSASHISSWNATSSPTNTNTTHTNTQTQVRMRRESAEKTLLQSSEKISRNLREKFTTLSTRFATRMKATYRMKPLPPFVLAQGSRLRERFGQSNENWIQYSNQD